MPAKPPVTIADDNRTPTTAVQQADANWAQPTSSGDGYHVTIGAQADSAQTDSAQSGTVVAWLKGLVSLWNSARNAVSGALKVMLTRADGTEIGTDAAPIATTITGSNPTGFEQVTVDATVGGVGFTAVEYGSATSSFITVETANVRFTFDGTPPTTTVGHLAVAGSTIELDTAAAIANFKAIRTGATSAVLTVTFKG